VRIREVELGVVKVPASRGKKDFCEWTMNNEGDVDQATIDS
jgi:hypothetical protein